MRLRELVVAKKRLVLLLDRNRAGMRVGVNESHAGIEQRLQLRAVVIADPDVVAEVENAGHTVEQVTERAVQREPVEIVVRRWDGIDVHGLPPLPGVEIGAEPAQRALVEVAVR